MHRDPSSWETNITTTSALLALLNKGVLIWYFSLTKKKATSCRGFQIKRTLCNESCQWKSRHWGHIGCILIHKSHFYVWARAASLHLLSWGAQSSVTAVRYASRVISDRTHGGALVNKHTDGRPLIFDITLGQMFACVVISDRSIRVITRGHTTHKHTRSHTIREC